jgi:uncharacterized protein (DUF1697 family)
VLLTQTTLRKIVEQAPAGFGSEDTRCDVIFLRKPLTAARAHAIAEVREGVDAKWSANGVLYFSRDAETASRSRLSKIVARPEYKNMTIRNWNTTQKLLGLMNERAAAS